MRLHRSIPWLLCGAAAGAAYLWWSGSAPAAAPELQSTASSAPALPLIAAPSPPSAPASAPPVAPRTLPAQASDGIGSEGYGPHIERALASGNGKLAMQAIQWLQECRYNNEVQAAFEAARAQMPASAASSMTAMMEKGQRTSRLCQTVTAQHQAMETELAQIAMQDKIPGAAAAYLATTSLAGTWQQLPSTQKDEVLASLRRDANSGDAQSMTSAIFMGSHIGISLVEQLTYANVLVADLPYANSDVQDETKRAMLKNAEIDLSKLSAEQVQAATTAAQRLLDAIRAKRKSG
jgi:hypothetical protein